MPKPTPSNPSAAMLVIGDEILSGRTRDANMYHLAGELIQHGFDLNEVRVVADNEAAIVDAVQALSASCDHVFTSGGIGPTHDDITADCVARAMGASIGIRDDARALLAAFYDGQGIEFNDARKRMARIPEGADLIDNPISTAPGFSLGNVHVMAGVPQVFQAMLAGLLPTLKGGAPLLSQSLQINRPEGEIAGPLADLAADFPTLSIGSYPFWKAGAFGANIVIRGFDKSDLDKALSRLAIIFEAAT